MISNDEKKTIRALYGQRYGATSIRSILNTEIKQGDRKREGRFETTEVRAYVAQIKNDPTVIEMREKNKARLIGIYGRIPAEKERKNGLLYKITKDDALLNKLHEAGSL